MKKTIIALVLLIGFTAAAQKGKEKSKKDKMTIEQRVALQTKKMTLALDLTEAQQQQVSALHLKNAKLGKVKMEERKAKKERDENKKPSADERYAMQMERLDHKIAQKAAMKKILSKEQLIKWQKMASHRKGKLKKSHRDFSKESK